MVHAEPVAEFLSADRTTALLALEHGRVLFRRDPVLPFKPACGDFFSIVRIVGVALAVVLQDLGPVAGVVTAIPSKYLFSVLRVLRVAFAPPLGRGEYRRRALPHILSAAACTLLGTAPLAPAMFARALAVTGHEMLRFPNAETRAARPQKDRAATQVGGGRFARLTCRSRENPRSVAFQA
jgi:hypothetical protein